MASPKSLSRTLLLWGLSAGGFNLALSGPGFFTLPAIVTAAASGLVALEETRKTKPKDWAQELTDLGLSLGTLTPSLVTPTAIPPVRIEVLPEPVKSWFMASAVDPTTPEFWTEKRARTSKIYVGSRGSGKSVLVNFHLTQMAAAGIDLKISDRHYPNGEFQWLPGVDTATLESRYLLRTAEDSYQAIMRLQEVLHNRIEGLSQDLRPKHLVIDEWNGLIRKWTPAQTTAAVEAISFIFDEGRKFGVDVSLVVHGLTREKTELPEPVTGAADLYLMGDALSQTTYTWPASISAERPKLLQARAGLVAQVSPPQRVLIYRDALSGEVYPVVAPDLSTAPPVEVATTVEDWAQAHRDSVKAMVQQGLSLRKISEKLKVARKSTDPHYEALKGLIAELSHQPATEEETHA